MKTADKVATILFRIIIGVIGLGVLVFAIKSKRDEDGPMAFTAIGSFCGLMLGYAFGGDKWGARVFAFLTHIPVHAERLDDAEHRSKPIEKMAQTSARADHRYNILKILHRIWTGIVAALAGAALAVLLQIIGRMTVGLSMDYLPWVLLIFAGGGFLLGVWIGPRSTQPPKPG